MDRSNESDEGGPSGLLNKAKNAVTGGEEDRGISDLADQARGGDTGASDRTGAGVGMFSSAGDDSVTSPLADRAEEHSTFAAGGYSTADTGVGTDAAAGTDMGAESYGTQSDYGAGIDRGGAVAGTGYGTDTYDASGASYASTETTGADPVYPESNAPDLDSSDRKPGEGIGPGDARAYTGTETDDGTTI